MSAQNSNEELLKKAFSKTKHLYNYWEGSFTDYLDIVKHNPGVIRNAFQRLYDCVMSYGSTKIDSMEGDDIFHYNFFDDPIENGKDAVYGLDYSLTRLMNVLKSATKDYGAEKRVYLLHGPVGSAKSTIVRMLKKGIEEYSLTDDGALYSFYWDGVPKHFEKVKWNQDKQKFESLVGGEVELETKDCPMHEEPLNLIPKKMRDDIIFKELLNIDVTAVETFENEYGEEEDPLFKYRIKNDLCPSCRQIYREMIRLCQDPMTVLQFVKIKRIFISEKDRIGIGTFQPKDEKNQDSTELTGDINYRKIAEYGSDSDPRAFNFDGELNIANRGLVEFIEVLKLDVAFLYDLLGASQEHKVKPKKFPQTDIDEVIIGHTNEPEYKKLQSDEFMEALRDRTIKIDVPYTTRLADEIKIYQKDYNKDTVRFKHIAPHTIEVAAMWAILTRLHDPKKADLSRIQKMKLYDGKTIPGYSEDDVKELRLEAISEGMDGISPRYIQDKISNALVVQSGNTVNPFMVMNELEQGLEGHSLLKDESEKSLFKELIECVKDEYTDIVKKEVEQAIAADEDGIKNLHTNYIDNVDAYTSKDKVKNKFTGDYEEADERLMRSVETKIDVPESRKDDFRREIMNFIGKRALKNKTFDWDSNEELLKAYQKKLFEDRKDSIKLTSLVSKTMDKETQEKIDVVKKRLIDRFGYNDESATDVLNYVASIFARGDIRNEEQ